MKINSKNTWISSDLHFFHKNIVEKFQPNRIVAWGNVEAMNSWLIEHINRVVGPNGVFIHLGDLSFGRAQETVELFSGIKVKEVHLILGNHDNEDATNLMIRRLNSIGSTQWRLHGERMTLKTEDNTNIVCDHFPLQVWNKNHHGALHVHGHCHGSLSNKGFGRRCDVGLDSPHVTGYPANRIFSVEEVVEYLKGLEFAPQCHHQ